MNGVSGRLARRGRADVPLALLAQHRDDLPTFFEQAAELPADRSPEALVEAILDRWLDYVREHQHAWVMLFRDSSGDEEIRAVRRAVSVRARELLAAFVADGAGAACRRSRSSRPPSS